MPRSARAFLTEMQSAVEYLLKQAASHSLSSYMEDETLRFAVERNFITLGEAMSQLRRDFPSTSVRIPCAAKVAAFRNLIIHQYWNVDDREVWSVLITQVIPLKTVIDELLADPSIT